MHIICTHQPAGFTYYCDTDHRLMNNLPIYLYYFLHCPGEAFKGTIIVLDATLLTLT